MFKSILVYERILTAGKNDFTLGCGESFYPYFPFPGQGNPMDERPGE
jgi:hypothetical protein